MRKTDKTSGRYRLENCKGHTSDRTASGSSRVLAVAKLFGLERIEDDYRLWTEWPCLLLVLSESPFSVTIWNQQNNTWKWGRILLTLCWLSSTRSGRLLFSITLYPFCYPKCIKILRAILTHSARALICQAGRLHSSFSNKMPSFIRTSPARHVLHYPKSWTGVGFVKLQNLPWLNRYCSHCGSTCSYWYFYNL